MSCDENKQICRTPWEDEKKSLCSDGPIKNWGRFFHLYWKQKYKYGMHSREKT